MRSWRPFGSLGCGSGSVVTFTSEDRGLDVLHNFNADGSARTPRLSGRSVRPRLGRLAAQPGRLPVENLAYQLRGLQGHLAPHVIDGEPR